MTSIELQKEYLQTLVQALKNCTEDRQLIIGICLSLQTESQILEYLDWMEENKWDVAESSLLPKVLEIVKKAK